MPEELRHEGRGARGCSEDGRGGSGKGGCFDGEEIVERLRGRVGRVHGRRAIRGGCDRGGDGRGGCRHAHETAGCGPGTARDRDVKRTAFIHHKSRQVHEKSPSRGFFTPPQTSATLSLFLSPFHKTLFG